jgi:vacuolar-type H+-ATPase subunit H
LEQIETLDKIKEAESRTAQMIARANEIKEKVIADAKQEALEMLEKAEEKTKNRREETLQGFQKEIDQEKNRRMRSAETQIEKFKSEARLKIAKEVEFLFEKFLEAIENA